MVANYKVLFSQDRDFRPRLEEAEGGARVNDRVVGVLLDGGAQQVAGQEAQAQLPLALEVEQLHRVNHLRIIRGSGGFQGLHLRVCSTGPTTS